MQILEEVIFPWNTINLFIYLFYINNDVFFDKNTKKEKCIFQGRIQKP